MTAPDPPRSRPSHAEREKRRNRSKRTLTGADHGREIVTGHPALFDMAPAFELGRIPEGGGYPVGFMELAFRLMGVTEPAEVLHLCSGSVIAPRTIDIRRETPARVIADVRWLPIRPASIRWALCDPPYGDDYAEALWGLGEQYPRPSMIFRELVDALEDLGMVGLLHHIVPALPPELERVGTWGVTTGTNMRIRAFTIARRRPRRLDEIHPRDVG